MSTEPAPTVAPAIEPSPAVGEKKPATSEAVSEPQEAPSTTTNDTPKPAITEALSEPQGAPSTITNDTPKPATTEALSEPQEAPSTTTNDTPKPATTEALSEPQEAPPTTTSDEPKPATTEAPSDVKPVTAAPETPAVEEPKPAADEKPSDTSSSAVKTEKTPAPPLKPLSKLFAELPSAIKEAEHDEMWGISLIDEHHIPTAIILEKFLRANTKDVSKAKAQLIEALKWRKKMQPRKLLEEMEFDKSKFGALGYVTVYPKTEEHEKEIVTWNIYGSVKDNKATFGNVEEFIEWRSALMELSVKELDLASATTPIPSDGPDPYRMIQVHDYLNVSFIRMDPTIRAASKKTIQTFSMAYPELLKEKFFVNVPLVMGWVFTAMKLFLSPETIKKFHLLSYGSSLAGELKGWGGELPPAYGGKGKDVKEGLVVKYASGDEIAAAADETKA